MTTPAHSPKAQGLYDPNFEHENCGIGLIVDMKGRKSHKIVQGALEICVNLDHRGGCGCDPITGDGAGIFIQLPTVFSQASVKKNAASKSQRKVITALALYFYLKMLKNAVARKCHRRHHSRRRAPFNWLAGRACPQ